MQGKQQASVQFEVGRRRRNQAAIWLVAADGRPFGCANPTGGMSPGEDPGKEESSANYVPCEPCAGCREVQAKRW